uniref:Uncharacterized protein n=1 Tax=Anguilla anguilla TaxID=7936 RepID=A0A0E9TM58_ANGAN
MGFGIHCTTYNHHEEKTNVLSKEEKTYTNQSVACGCRKSQRASKVHGTESQYTTTLFYDTFTSTDHL